MGSEACGRSCPAPGGSGRAGSAKQQLNHLFIALFFRFLLYVALAYIRPVGCSVSSWDGRAQRWGCAAQEGRGGWVQQALIALPGAGALLPCVRVALRAHRCLRGAQSLAVAVLPSVCFAAGTAMVQPAGLQCRYMAGAPLLGCFIRCASLRVQQASWSAHALGIICSLKCLLPCSCRVMLFTSRLSDELRYAGSQLQACSSAVCGQ